MEILVILIVLNVLANVVAGIVGVACSLWDFDLSKKLKPALGMFVFPGFFLGYAFARVLTIPVGKQSK